jgi:hypothetical protein
MLFRTLPFAPGCNKVPEKEKTSGNHYTSPFHSKIICTVEHKEEIVLDATPQHCHQRRHAYPPLSPVLPEYRVIVVDIERR